jgi:predicted nucleic acid-binding Zn ribbon protein
MPSDQVVVYCKNCKKSTVQVKQRANHILHLLLSVVTVGIWLIVWFFIALFTSDTPTCTICGNEVKNNNNKRETTKKEIENKNPELKTKKLSKLKIFFIVMGVLLVIGIFIPDEQKNTKLKTTDKSKSDDRQKGFHCLSSWDSSSRALVDHVKKNMRDPDSFKHRETRIGPNINNTHFIHMMYSGKNGFGGVTVEGISGKLSSDCKLIEVNAK